MTVNLNQFFPAAKSKLDKLMKVVQMDFEQNENIIEQMLNFCKNTVKECETGKKQSAVLYGKAMQNAAEYRNMVKSGKHPNGLPLSKEEKKDFKEKMKNQKALAKSYESDFKRYERNKERLLNNIEQLIGRWKKCFIRDMLKQKIKNP